MIISGINSCVVIAGILLLHNQLDVLSVFISGIAAFIINLTLALILMKGKLGWKFGVYSVSISKKVLQNIGFAELGQMATMASSFLPLFILSGFGSGVVSLMNYGKNIADIPNSIITAQITSVSAIELNEEAAKNDQLAMQQIFFRTGKLLLYLLVPISFFMFLFSHPIVQLFYMRGNFSIAEVDGASEFLQWLSLAIFSIGINALVSRVFAAMQAIRQATNYQLSLNTLLFVLIWALTGKFGAIGYPYAVVLMNLINFILMYFLCKLLVSFINYITLVKYMVQVLLINASIAIPIYFGIPYLHLTILPMLIISFFVYLFALVMVNKFSGNKHLI